MMAFNSRGGGVDAGRDVGETSNEGVRSGCVECLLISMILEHHEKKSNEMRLQIFKVRENVR